MSDPNCTALGGVCEWPTTCEQRGCCAYVTVTWTPEDEARLDKAIADRAERRKVTLQHGGGAMPLSDYLAQQKADSRRAAAIEAARERVKQARLQQGGSK